MLNPITEALYTIIRTNLNVDSYPSTKTFGIYVVDNLGR